MHHLLFKDSVQGRDPALKEIDLSAVNAIVQAALNVELFTIPLYLTSMYSLYGLHPITSSNNLYQGRLWPGMTTHASPSNENASAFNAIFSVAIAEMLHLQLASNICSAVRVSPSFTSPALQNEQQGWTCYGPQQTLIPHILDFRDTVSPYNGYVVNLGAVNEQQINLFLAIEETEAKSEEILKESEKHKYFPSVPFAGWKKSNTERDLPLFGSIGHMYYNLWEYISIQYSDGSTLWDAIFSAPSLQNDIFNGSPKPFMPEYPHLNTAFSSSDSDDAALAKLLNMIDGITDQGEGKGVVPRIKARLKQSMPAEKSAELVKQYVENIYQPDEAALENNYTSYDDKGNKLPSADAYARSTFGKLDHYDTFKRVMGMLDTIVTWDKWHDSGKTWLPSMLETSDPGPYSNNLPSTQEVADALNNLKHDHDGANYRLLSHVAAGSIAGVTTVLNKYWSTPGNDFPFPSMYGSGDRISICWAIFGKAPDLSVGAEKQTDTLYHSCQGLDLNDPSSTMCANIAAFHTCKGSNSCMAQGGCGFVHIASSGGSGCGSKLAMVESTKTSSHTGEAAKAEDTSGAGVYYSAPSDNQCNAYGGCAVPISASQLYSAAPADMAGMELFDFKNGEPVPLHDASLPAYSEGTPVYQIAWQAYCKVIESRGQTPPANPPAPSNIRLAFPPST